jgi:hypothetical protein
MRPPPVVFAIALAAAAASAVAEALKRFELREKK